MKKVEAWQTENGKLFILENDAIEYEIQNKIIHGLRSWTPKFFIPTNNALAENDELTRMWRAISSGWRELRDIFNDADSWE